MRQSVTRELYSYWTRLKGDRSAPERSEIDPAQIRDALADAFIIEIDARGAFPIRLCGTRLNALWLTDQKGKSFAELWNPEDRGDIAAMLWTVVDEARPVVAGVVGTVAGSLEAADLELLLLPLRHYGKTHSRVLGSLSPARQPRWLGLAPAEPLRLRSFRVIREQEAKHRQSSFTGGAFHPRAAVGRPELVLHRGGKM